MLDLAREGGAKAGVGVRGGVEVGVGGPKRNGATKETRRGAEVKLLIERRLV